MTAAHNNKIGDAPQGAWLKDVVDGIGEVAKHWDNVPGVDKDPRPGQLQFGKRTLEVKNNRGGYQLLLGEGAVELDKSGKGVEKLEVRVLHDEGNGEKSTTRLSKTVEGSRDVYKAESLSGTAAGFTLTIDRSSGETSLQTAPTSWADSVALGLFKGLGPKLGLSATMMAPGVFLSLFGQPLAPFFWLAGGTFAVISTLATLYTRFNRDPHPDLLARTERT